MPPSADAGIVRPCAAGGGAAAAAGGLAGWRAGAAVRCTGGIGGGGASTSCGGVADAAASDGAAAGTGAGAAGGFGATGAGATGAGATGFGATGFGAEGALGAAAAVLTNARPPPFARAGAPPKAPALWATLGKPHLQSPNRAAVMSTR